jgi:hypothetical protein
MCGESVRAQPNRKHSSLASPLVEIRVIRVLRPFPCASVSICVQVDKTIVNTGFLERMDGHCQRKSQSGGELQHNLPLLARTR